MIPEGLRSWCHMQEYIKLPVTSYMFKIFMEDRKKTNFQWVWRFSCLKAAGTDHIFVCGDGWKVKSKKKSKCKRRNGRPHYAQCCPHKARTPRWPQDNYTFCCQEGWKVALKSMVGFLNTYFELLQFTEIIYITNKCNQYVICLSFIPFVRLFMRNIQTAVSSHPLKTGHMIIWTYLLGTVRTTTS
jgi:hypothetical protein